MTSQRIAALRGYWLGKCPADGWPSRADIHPADLAPLLPNIVISEIYPETGRVHYRLVGTKVAEMSRFDFTGRWLHEMRMASHDPGIWERAYAILTRERVPVYGRTGIPIESGSEIIVEEEFGLFPLDVGAPDRFQCLALEDYGDIQHIEADELRPMRPI